MSFIDAYSHFCPPSFLKYMNDHAKSFSPDNCDHVFKPLFENTITLIDISARLEQMAKYAIEKSVLVPLPWIESIPQVHADKILSYEAAEFINTEMATIAQEYPDKFYSIGMLPTVDLDYMMKAYQTAIHHHQLHGLVLFVGPQQKPLDHPDYLHLFTQAAQDDVPVWIHPCRSYRVADYQGEKFSKYMIWQTLGWVFDSSCAMIRLGLSGIFEQCPNLKVITHHHGAMIPLFSERMNYSLEFFVQKGQQAMPDLPNQQDLTQNLKYFYCDTALSSYQPLAIQQAVDFFGEDRVLFGTDSPMEVSGGIYFIENAQKSLAEMNIDAAIKKKIQKDNILKVLRSRRTSLTARAHC